MTDNLKPTCTIDYDEELNMDIEWHGAVGMDDLPVAGTKLYAIPAGFSLVPDEPTAKMIAAMQFSGDIFLAIGHSQMYLEAEIDYKAMLKAAKESK